jgi:hypothetical protein
MKTATSSFRSVCQHVPKQHPKKGFSRNFVPETVHEPYGHITVFFKIEKKRL